MQYRIRYNHYYVVYMIYDRFEFLSCMQRTIQHINVSNNHCSNLAMEWGIVCIWKDLHPSISSQLDQTMQTDTVHKMQST